MVLRRVTLLIVLTLIAGSVYAQTDRVLIPIYSVDLPGAYDSVWHTTLDVYNGNLSMTGIDLRFFCSVGPCHPPALYPGETHSFIPTETDDNPGVIAHVQSPSDNVWFHLATRDLTKQAETFGTEIPVVRDKAFYDHPFYLFTVPTDPNFRVMLRLYELDGRADVVVQIRALSIETTQSYGSAQVTLTPPTANVVPNKPSYAHVQILPALIPGIPTTGRSYALEIAPKTAGVRVWGFLTVTHNTTQHVTTITPQ